MKCHRVTIRMKAIEQYFHVIRSFFFQMKKERTKAILDFPSFELGRSLRQTCTSVLLLLTESEAT